MKGQARLIVKDKDGNIKNDVTKSNVIFDIPKVIMQNWLNNVDNMGGINNTYYTSTPFEYITKIQPWFNSIKINDVEVSETDYTDWKFPILYGSTESRSDTTNNRYSQRDETRSSVDDTSFTNSWIWSDIPESFDVKSINLFWGYPTTTTSSSWFGKMYYTPESVTNNGHIECPPKKISNKVVLTRSYFPRSNYNNTYRKSDYYKFRHNCSMYQLLDDIKIKYNGRNFIAENQNYQEKNTSIYSYFNRFYTISNNRFISLDYYDKTSTNTNVGTEYLKYITIHPDNSIANEDIIAQFNINQFTTDGTTPITTSTSSYIRNRICFLTNNNDTYMYFYNQGKMYIYLLPIGQDDNLQMPIEILNIVDSTTSSYDVQMRVINNYIQFYLWVDSINYIKTIELKSNGTHIIYNRGMYNNNKWLYTEGDTSGYVSYQVDMQGEDVDAGSSFPIWYNTTALNLSTPVSISAGDTLIVDYTITAE